MAEVKRRVENNRERRWEVSIAGHHILGCLLAIYPLFLVLVPRHQAPEMIPARYRHALSVTSEPRADLGSFG